MVLPALRLAGAAVSGLWAVTGSLRRPLPPPARDHTFTLRVTGRQMVARDENVVALTLAAVDGADLVITDTWVSMGDSDVNERRRILKPYRVDKAMMSAANSKALFMHCLPAHRGDEVTSDVMDGPQSVVFDEAENRLHAQKGVLAWCFGWDEI